MNDGEEPLKAKLMRAQMDKINHDRLWEKRRFWVSVAGVVVAGAVATIGLLAAGHWLLPPPPVQTVTVRIEGQLPRRATPEY